VNKNSFRSFGILFGALSAASYSCSPSAAPSGAGLTIGTGAIGGAAGSAGAPVASAGMTTGGPGSAGGGPAAAGSGSGGSVAIHVDASMDGSTTIEEDAACGTGEATAMLKEVNMFVMFDRSWSMTECGDGTPYTGGDPRCTTGPSRWELTSEALKQFFMDPGAADLRVALRFFPDDHPAAGCDGYPAGGGFMGGFMMGGQGMGGMPGAAGATATTPNCDVNACAMPLVDIAPLTADPGPSDVQEQKLLDAIATSAPPDTDNLNPNPQTPTSAALAGAAQWATTYQSANPNAKTVIILITDGEPAGCDQSIDNIARIASDAYTTSGVTTYVIGLTGSNEATLDQIAVAGGTTEAYTVSDGNTATSDLLAKLIAIRGEALSCDFPVPTSDSSGKEIDPTLINVNYQSGTTGMPTEFGIVPSAADCGTALGWFYDNPAAPKQISLCPAACELVTADPSANIQVLAGCKPHVVTK
jgi:hypothetical protein